MPDHSFRFLYSAMDLIRLAVLPFRLVYLNGPSVLFWEGKAACDVCAELTGAAAAFWLAHPEECDDLIHRRVVGIAIGSAVVFAACALYGVSSAVWYRYAIVRPMVDAIGLAGASSTFESAPEKKKKWPAAGPPP